MLLARETTVGLIGPLTVRVERASGAAFTSARDGLDTRREPTSFAEGVNMFPNIPSALSCAPEQATKTMIK
jgi:hypothetical protein